MKKQAISKITPKEQAYELSLGQKALWFVHSIGNDAESTYNEPFIYTIKGNLSIPALSSALNAVIQKHAILRSSFRTDEEGVPFQVVEEYSVFELKVVENNDLNSISDYIFQEIKNPFDLTLAPLMRVTLLKISPNEYSLIIFMHHIIMDGMSFGIFIQDLNDFYNRKIQGESLNNIKPTGSYFDYIKTENHKFLSKEYREKVDEFAKALSGYAGLNFLTTPSSGELKDSFAGDRVYFNLDKETLSKLKGFSNTEHITIFHFLFSAYSLLLSHYTRSQDILIGVPFANRGDAFERKIMGLFTNTIPIRFQLDTTESFSSFVSNTKSLILSYLCRQDIEFEHLLEKLNLERKPSGHHPLIQTLFVWGSSAKLQLNLQNTDSYLEQQYFTRTSKFDLSLFMFEEDKETVKGYFEYRKTLFDRSYIERLAFSFQILIKNILINPNNIISSFSLLDESEKLRMKQQFFTAKLDRVVTTSLATLFSKTASQYGNRIGLIFGQDKYDYKTLESRSNQWAYYIRSRYQQLYGKEMPRDTLIALCVDRNEDMIFGILGILKAGAAYVPVDPQYPKDRIDYIINHSKASLLLTHKKHRDLSLDFNANHVVYMDDPLIQESPFFIDKDHTHTINPEDVAYVLYTSGSTGKPKGVSVTHENIICLFESLKEQFDISHQDIWSLFHTFCFDISVWEIWGAFLFGGALLVIPFEVTRDPRQFYELIESEKVTVLSQTPSAFQMFINEDKKTSKLLSHLRYIAFVGESLKVSILRPWVEKYGVHSPRLANMYGITETTVYTNYKFVEQADIDRGRDNIGWPLRDFSMCILNDNLEWCPVGIVGEICIGGRGLSRGYLYRDDLTQEKFFPDPYINFLNLKKDAKLYRTGDLGRWLEDGSIEYLGRKDFQIKLRGFRIELGEIESALGAINEISHTAVLLKGSHDSAYLAAFYTLKPGNTVTVSKILTHLKSYLPEYMIPKTFTELASFPITVNGKIDRKALDAVKDTINIEENKGIINPGIESDIASVWAEVLNIPITQIGSQSNFFNLGGNSLLVIKMLTLVSKKINRELSLAQFIAAPNIINLSQQSESHNLSKKAAADLCARLKNDVLLNPLIQPLNEKNPNQNNPRGIFITGATGFLGAHLLHVLLEHSDSKIYCLVRAATVEEAKNKILSKLNKYKLFSTNEDRIFPLIGNLAHSRLGLSDDDFDRLTSNVDSIFHVGALVHHIFDYSTLYNANVESVNELLKLATTCKNKTLHFISTLAASMISPINLLSEYDAASPIDRLNLNGYIVGKWVAECLIAEAYKRGIQAHIYRPGNIIAGSSGVYDPDSNHTLLRLKGMLQLEKGYLDKDEQIEMMPVDTLAAAIYKISQNPKKLAYNMNNPDTISWASYLNYAKKIGYNFQFINNIKDWVKIMKTLDVGNAMYKISHFYSNPTLNKTSRAEPISVNSDYPFPAPLYKEMIMKQFDSLIKSGFLPEPLAKVE